MIPKRLLSVVLSVFVLIAMTIPMITPLAAFAEDQPEAAVTEMEAGAESVQADAVETAGPEAPAAEETVAAEAEETEVPAAVGGEATKETAAKAPAKGTRAAEPKADGTANLAEDEPVAMIERDDGPVYFTKLNEAKNAVETDETIVLLRDVDLDQGADSSETILYADKTFALDLNGKTISRSGSGSCAIWVASSGVLTIGGNGKIITTGGDQAIKVEGALEVLNGAIVADDCSKAAIVNDNGSVVIGTTGAVRSLWIEGKGCDSVQSSGENAGFYIRDGSFSDDAGNGEGFSRRNDLKLTDREGDGVYVLSDRERIARIVDTGKEYPSLEAAVDEASDGDTIQMIADEILDGTVTVNKTLTLDLNGKTVSGTAERLIYVSGGTLTIDDSGSGGMIHNNNSSGWKAAVKVGETSGPRPGLTVKGGTLKSDKGYGIENAGTLDIEGGSILSGNYTAVYNYNGTVTVSGTDTLLQGHDAIDTNKGWPGKTYIKGGTLKSTAGGTAGAITVRSGTVEISGGVIEGPYGINVTHGGDPSTGTVTFTEDSTSVVTGTKYGTFKKNGGTVNIKGGCFSDDIGNGEEYNRPECRALKEVTDGEHAGYYELQEDHDWDTEAVEISWNEDNTECTATVVCKRDESHTLSETVTPTAEITKEPTATEWGWTTYTANFTDEILKEAVGEDNTLSQEDIEPLGVYKVTEGDGQTWTKGSGVSLDFHIEKTFHDDTTFGSFTGIKVDGKEVPASEYKTEKGSVIVKIQPAYLEKLGKGKHEITAEFEDGSADADFTIREGGAKTGDEADLGLFTLAMLTSLGALCGIAALRRRFE